MLPDAVLAACEGASAMAYRLEDASSSGAGGSIDEPALVQRAQRGDQAAFDTLFERYVHPISRYLKHMVGNDGVSCELTQETFFRAWRGLQSLRDPQRFAGWLYRIARNVAHSYLQQASKLQLVSWEDSGGDLAEQSAAWLEQHLEERELTAMALARVSPVYRSCLILYVIEELPQRRIADLLGMKESSVSKYVSRGKEELRQIYERLAGEGSARPQGGGRRR
jgi:RNA polymerase sigma-70 factor (ECF subfamily)